MQATPRVRSAIAPRLAGFWASARYGRVRARAPRYAFLVFVAVMSIAGIRASLLPSSAPETSGPSGPPVDYAEQSFALAFARAYLTYDVARPGRRERALAQFASSGLEGGAGFSPPSSGSQRVQWADVAQVQRPLVGGVIVSVAAQLSDQRSPVYLSVPVDRQRGGAIYIAGYPSFVGPPLSTTTAGAEPGGESVDEPEVTSLVHRALSNYLAGDAENLAADLADAATVTLPTNPLHLEAVDQLDWVRGAGGGAVLATVSASDQSGATYTLRYEVGVVRVDASDPRLGPGWRITYVQTVSQQS